MKENEIIWKPEHNEHEPCCLYCRQEALGYSEEDLETMDLLEEQGL